MAVSPSSRREATLWATPQLNGEPMDSSCPHSRRRKNPCRGRIVIQVRPMVSWPKRGVERWICNGCRKVWTVEFVPLATTPPEK